MRLLKSKRAIAVTVVGALAVIGSGIGAFAYWSTTGTGNGTASVGTATAVTITPITFAATLYPGATTGVTFTVNNPSTTTSVKVGQVVIDTSVATGAPNGISGLSGNCLAADFVFAPSSTLSYTIAPSSSVTDATATLMLKNTALNQDDCKNAAPVLHLTVPALP